MEFEGRWDQYLVNFGIYSLYKGQTFQYTARPVGEVSVALSETVKFYNKFKFLILIFEGNGFDGNMLNYRSSKQFNFPNWV